MRQTWIKLAAVTALPILAIVAWACGGGGSGDPDAAAGRVTVVAEDTLYSPDAITMPAGQEVTLELENRDAFEHDLQVDGLEVEVIAGGTDRPEHGDEHGRAGEGVAVHTTGDDTAAITFKANAPGTYEFYCTIPGHRDSGMIGTLTIE